MPGTKTSNLVFIVLMAYALINKKQLTIIGMHTSPRKTEYLSNSVKGIMESGNFTVFPPTIAFVRDRKQQKLQQDI
jgi:hypothetical protein